MTSSGPGATVNLLLRCRFAFVSLEEEALEIGRDLNVHRWRLGFADLAQHIAPSRKGTCENIVGVCCNHQSAAGKPHALCYIASKNVAKVAGRHAKGDLPPRRAESSRAREIIDGLEKDAGEVNRIDAAEVELFAQGVVIEHGLDASLGIIERAFKRDHVNIGGPRRCHLAALDLRHAAVRIKDKDIGLRKAAEGLDGRSSGIAGSCADDGYPLSLGFQDVTNHPGEELHSQILEGEGRAVEQLEEEKIAIELHQGSDRLVIEARIGVINHLAQGVPRDLARHKGSKNSLCGPGVGFDRELRDLLL